MARAKQRKQVMGRPRRDPNTLSNEQVKISLTAAEKAAWSRAAEAAESPSVVAWAREVCNRACKRGH